MWQSAPCPNTGVTYYFNSETNVSQWERPAGFQEAVAPAVSGSQLLIRTAMGEICMLLREDKAPVTVRAVHCAGCGLVFCCA